MEIPKLVRGSLPFSCERQLVSFLGGNLTLKEVRSIHDDISISIETLLLFAANARDKH